MTAWWIVLGILAFVLLLLLLPVHVSLRFREELEVRVRYAFVSLRVYPRPEKPAKKEKKKAARAHRRAKKKETEEKLPQLEKLFKEDGVSAVAAYLQMMAKLAADALRRALRVIVVDRLQVRLIVVGEDAADTAVRYGKICAAVYPAQAVLETVMKVRRRQIDVEPGFLQEKSSTAVDLRAHVQPLRVLAAAVGLLVRWLVNTVRQESAKEAASEGAAG
ncbi:MAG: DUF2953 domain-containing protein [Clostridiales bacterium]|nr:DUF2953 domain-containing protein [Clostridiales bacterium]